MKIRTRMSMSLDGYVTTPDGWLASSPTLTSAPRRFTAITERRLPGGPLEVTYAVA